MNVAEFILRIIEKLGTDTAFCLTGGMAMYINHAAAESNLRIIYCNHEQAVAAAADGYARAKEFRTPGLAIVTSGPGVTNTITSVASSYQDSVPLFILAGQVKKTDINIYGVRSRGAQETPHLELMSPITKCAFRYIPSQIDDVTLASHLAQAITGRKGPVFIDIPLDIQNQIVIDADNRIDTIFNQIMSIVTKDTNIADQTLNTIISELQKAKKPLLVIGNGLRIAGVDRSIIKKLVEQLEIPTLFTWASFDLLPHSHDLNFGCPGGLAPTHANIMLQSADLVLFLGVRLDLLTTAFNPGNFGKNAHRLIVEIDVNEIEKNAFLSNTTFFNEHAGFLAEALLQKKHLIPTQICWLNQCRSLRTKDQLNEIEVFNKRKLTTYQIARVLSESPIFNYFVPVASGYAIEGIVRFFKPSEGTIFSLSGHSLGSMGLGLPTAIGAAAALKQAVICLEGDGSLLLNVQELFTLSSNPDLLVTVMVLNNQGYQSIIQSQKRAFNKEFGASPSSGLFELEFDLLAKLANLHYQRCKTLLELEVALTNGVTRQLIEVVIEEESYRGPVVTTRFDEQGKPYSTDIADVTWNK